MTRWS